jgi:L-asparaginase/Glu-tRNA(Gln) amidotransferase subunit D
LEKLQWGIPVIETGGTIAEKKNDEEESELRWTEDMSYPGTHKEDSDDSDESI